MLRRAVVRLYQAGNEAASSSSSNPSSATICVMDMNLEWRTVGVLASLAANRYMQAVVLSM
eukprot:scaffold652391_cov78-Prasinocladus_malaysianus.AAC.1